MGKRNFSKGFKRNAAHQIMVRGYPVREVADRLSTSTHSLYKSMNLYTQGMSQAASVDHETEKWRE